jgi:hypothetical protein
MIERQICEYRALRDTIRQRGTVRLALVPIVFLGWAATSVANAAAIGLPVSTLVPLLVLAAGFEAIFALHINVERIGRYLQAFHEADGGWEHVAMTFGQRFPSAGPDPLFAQLFVFGISINFLPVALGGELPEIVVLAVIHLLAVYRVRRAHVIARRQRVEDLERFQSLRGGG